MTVWLMPAPSPRRRRPRAAPDSNRPRRREGARGLGQRDVAVPGDAEPAGRHAAGGVDDHHAGHRCVDAQQRHQRVTRRRPRPCAAARGSRRCGRRCRARSRAPAAGPRRRTSCGRRRSAAAADLAQRRGGLEAGQRRVLRREQDVRVAQQLDCSNGPWPPGGLNARSSRPRSSSEARTLVVVRSLVRGARRPPGAGSRNRARRRRQDAYRHALERADPRRCRPRRRRAR